MIGIRHCVDNPPCKLLYFLVVNFSTLQGALLSIYAPFLNSHVCQSVTGCEKIFCCVSKTFTDFAEDQELGYDAQNFLKMSAAGATTNNFGCLV
jgi:hypothetical protein